MSKRRGSANKMNGAAASSRDTGLTLFDTTMCETSEPSRALSTQDTSTCSAEDSPARTCHTRGTVLALRANEAVCGESSRESFANFDRESSSWKTSQRSLLGGWTSFSENWPRSGMMRSGRAFELPTLERRTDETDSSSSRGWWMTPSVMDSFPFSETSQERVRRQKQVMLVHQVNDSVAVRVGGHSGMNPDWEGQLMGFPAGWTSPITDGPSAQENSKGSGKRLASRRSGTNDDND